MNIAPKLIPTLILIGLAVPSVAAPPQVTARHPSRQQINAPTNTAIQAEFNMFIDPASVDAISFRVFGRWSGPATGTIDVYENTITFDPDEPLFAGEYVTVWMSKGIKNTLGEPMTFGHAWSFWIKSGVGTLDLDYVTRYDTRLPTDSWVQPYGAYAGDINNDGWGDLFVPCEQTDDVRVFMNNGAGLYPGDFTRETPANMNIPSPNEAGDIDNDGEIDLVVGNVGNNRVTVMFGDGTGDFPTNNSLIAADVSVRGVGILDLNGDGWDDIAATVKNNGGKVSLFLNNGDGTFAPKVDVEAGVGGEFGLAVADINNDGIMDAFMSNFDLPRYVTVLLGNGAGGLVAQTPVPTSGQPWMLAAGDLNGDGNVDVCSANSSGNGIGIHYGNGSGGISAVTNKGAGTFPLAIDVGDIDGDQDLEIVASNYGSATWTLWENNGAGNFVNPRSIPASSAASCATLHDRDNDGDMDITGLDEVDDWVYLYENNPAPTDTGPVPHSLLLGQNQPNPFNPYTTIHFDLPSRGEIELAVYDATGARVSTIASGAYDAGPHDVRWNGTDAFGVRVASGVYFYRLRSNGVQLARKMTLLK